MFESCVVEAGFGAEEGVAAVRADHDGGFAAFGAVDGGVEAVVVKDAHQALGAFFTVERADLKVPGAVRGRCLLQAGVVSVVLAGAGAALLALPSGLLAWVVSALALRGRYSRALG